MFVDLAVGPARFRARLLDERSPGAASALRERLPLRAELLLDEWSGFVARIGGGSPLSPRVADRVIAFPYPGLLMLDPANGDLAVCYGQGRLQNGLGPLASVPVCEIGGDLSELTAIGTRLQYDGTVDVEIAAASDQTSPLLEPPAESSRRVSLELGGVGAIAELLERSAPNATRAFAEALPLEGIATNTFLSGPLTRLRRADAPDAELVLETGETDTRHVVLWPGYVYYRLERPRGLRIAAREATIMGGQGLGGASRLVPLARFRGDWSAFRAEAERLSRVGARPLRIAHAPSAEEADRFG
jgi:hypothetical protein